MRHRWLVCKRRFANHLNFQVEDLYGDARYRTLGIRPTATAKEIRQVGVLAERSTLCYELRHQVRLKNCNMSLYRRTGS